MPPMVAQVFPTELMRPRQSSINSPTDQSDLDNLSLRVPGVSVQYQVDKTLSQEGHRV